MGTAADSVTLYYMLFCEDRILEEKVYSVSDTIMDFTYPSVPDGADGMQAVFYLVRDGRCSTREVRLVRPCPERKLRLAWTSFRDRLQPGTEETWRLRVTLPDGRPAPAQLMATLYDTSLGCHSTPAMAGIFYQSFQVYILGQSVSTINIFPFLQSNSENYLLGYDRPHSFFLEPAAYCTWILPFLCMCMKRKEHIWMVFISISILLSTSSTGILMTE